MRHHPQMTAYQEAFEQIQGVTNQLFDDTNARVLFILDRQGQLVAASGDVEHLDTTSLGALVAKHAGHQETSKRLKESGSATLQADHASLYLHLVERRLLLLVSFDARSTLGLVRLRVRQASEGLVRILNEALAKPVEPGTAPPFAKFTDSDIDRLFPA